MVHIFFALSGPTFFFSFLFSLFLFFFFSSFLPFSFLSPCSLDIIFIILSLPFYAAAFISLGEVRYGSALSLPKNT